MMTNFMAETVLWPLYVMDSIIGGLYYWIVMNGFPLPEIHVPFEIHWGLDTGAIANVVHNACIVNVKRHRQERRRQLYHYNDTLGPVTLHSSSPRQNRLNINLHVPRVAAFISCCRPRARRSDCHHHLLHLMRRRRRPLKHTYYTLLSESVGSEGLGDRCRDVELDRIWKCGRRRPRIINRGRVPRYLVYKPMCVKKLIGHST
ncbi:hypothetical protein QBC45DRAFT_56871 [Copromyces sp. CBS 386.78]|nr:hypothetical protein QBC45DRAFT_56871 [Copromyces sp. CBS 386.78]